MGGWRLAVNHSTFKPSICTHPAFKHFQVSTDRKIVIFTGQNTDNFQLLGGSGDWFVVGKNAWVHRGSASNGSVAHTVRPRGDPADP